MAKKEKNNLIVEVDDSYEIDIEDLPEDLPSTYQGSPIQWLGNVNVKLREGRSGIQNAKYKVAHIGGRQLVYYKNDQVLPLPQGNFLPVGDPPIGII
jgi:hypothetical protein